MRFYQYAGNPSCGCCDDPCPYIQISRCNFNEYCNTSGEEWREHDYGTQANPNKLCELWYTQSATISIDSTKTGKVDSSVWIDGFTASAWDAKYRGSSQTRADGDTFVITETVTLGTHTIVYSQANEWVYNSDNADYDRFINIGVWIDGNCYWTDVLEYRGDSSTSPSYEFNLVLFRRGENVDVYTSDGNRWVWSFTDNTENTFTYSFQAVYTGSTKYIYVDPNLEWRTVKYITDSGCVYYPPGALTQAQINDIEERQRLIFEDNEACRYTTGTTLPEFSPPMAFTISNKPTEYSACPSTYRVVYYATSIGGTSYTPPVWEIQKTSYCMDSGIARRINVFAEYVSTVQAVNNCSELPYGYTIDYWEYATDSAGLSIITAPQYGTASIVVDLDGNNEPYIRRIRYVAPSALPTGTCIDWLQYEVTGRYGEKSRGVLKFKLYPEAESQYQIWEDYLYYPSEGIIENSEYSQQVLKLTIQGERANVGDIPSDSETHWSVELYGLLPPGKVISSSFAGVPFSFIDGVSNWEYQCGNIGDTGDIVRSSNPPSSQDPLYPCYLSAKAMLEAITARRPARLGNRTTDFVVSNNNIIDSCSTSAIDSTTTTIAVKLVKNQVYTVYTGGGSTTTRTALDSQTLPNQTVIIDWGTSPAESPVGLIVPESQPIAIDITQYYSRFNVYTVHLTVTIEIGQITTKTTPASGVLWTGNNQSGTTPGGDSWSSYDEVKVEIQDSTTITYF